MYVIKVLSHFSGAHRLRYLHGKCEELPWSQLEGGGFRSRPVD